MAIHSTDPRIIYVHHLMTEEGRDLADLLVDLLRVRSKWRAYGILLQRLSKQEVDLANYCESELVKFGDLHLPSAESERLAVKHARKVSVYLAKAFSSLRALGSRIASGNTINLENEAKARDLFRNHPIAIIGRNGRLYSYSLEYYVSLVINQAFCEHRTAVVLEKARINGSDLVAVSCSSESAGSPCSKYEGTYSLSGKRSHSSFFMAQGGPPYHPWCSAELEIVEG